MFEEMYKTLDKLKKKRDFAEAIYINNESCGCDSEEELRRSFIEYIRAERQVQHYISKMER
jgi:hypothetical protein